jgi:CheY-like chemotaxis protein
LTTSRPRETTLAAREGSGHVDVLIADDDALTRRGLRRLLEHWGFRCAEAGDGREAIDLAVRQPPHCVLLDLVMPRLDGLAVTRALRADRRTRAAHIYCMTDLADPLARRWAMEAGCEGFLVKPVDPAELLEALRGPAASATPSRVSGLTLGEAESLLDWLQNQGCTGLRVTLEEQGAAVYCICPPGWRLYRDEGGAVRFQKLGRVEVTPGRWVPAGCSERGV